MTLLSSRRSSTYQAFFRTTCSFFSAIVTCTSLYRNSTNSWQTTHSSTQEWNPPKVVNCLVHDSLAAGRVVHRLQFHHSPMIVNWRSNRVSIITSITVLPQTKWIARSQRTSGRWIREVISRSRTFLTSLQISQFVFWCKNYSDR